MVVELGGEHNSKVIKIFNFCPGVKMKNSFMTEKLNAIIEKYPIMFNAVMEYAGRMQYIPEEKFLGIYWIAVLHELRLKFPEAGADLRKLCFSIKMCKPCTETGCPLNQYCN